MQRESQLFSHFFLSFRVRFSIEFIQVHAYAMPGASMSPCILSIIIYKRCSMYKIEKMQALFEKIFKRYIEFSEKKRWESKDVQYYWFIDVHIIQFIKDLWEVSFSIIKDLWDLWEDDTDKIGRTDLWGDEENEAFFGQSFAIKAWSHNQSGGARFARCMRERWARARKR